MLALLGGCGVDAAAHPSMYTFPSGVETRWTSPENPRGGKGSAAQSNGGRKGRASIPLRAGEQVTLAEAHGTSGVVRRIWATISDRSPAMLRGLKIEMFWDDATEPAVSAPLGDFFGLGIGEMATFQAALFASPEGRSFNCYVPMPFKSSMKIVVTNESGKDLPLLFYDVNYTLGDRHGADMLYFHAHFRRESPTKLQHDFEILPRVVGKGRFLGVTLGVEVDRARYVDKWWGEGEVKIYLDGDGGYPTLAGTGTEDYVGTAWLLGRYANLYQGAPFVDGARMRYSLYRHHVLDPVYFSKDVRVTIQQIGASFATRPDDPLFARGAPVYQAGPGLVEAPRDLPGLLLFERQDDWSSCAYFYLDRPANALPRIATADVRMKGLGWGGPRFLEDPHVPQPQATPGN
jgi:hypothetical protein